MQGCNAPYSGDIYPFSIQTPQLLLGFADLNRAEVTPAMPCGMHLSGFQGKMLIRASRLSVYDTLASSRCSIRWKSTPHEAHAGFRTRKDNTAAYP